MSSFMVTESHMNAIYAHLKVRCASSCGRYHYFRAGVIETPRTLLKFDNDYETSLKDFVQQLYKTHIRALNAQYPSDKIEVYRMRIKQQVPLSWTQVYKLIECFLYQTEVHRLDEHDKILVQHLEDIANTLVRDIVRLTDAYNKADWELKDSTDNKSTGIIQII